MQNTTRDLRLFMPTCPALTIAALVCGVAAPATAAPLPDHAAYVVGLGFPGTHQPVYGSATDAYVAKFGVQGLRGWGWYDDGAADAPFGSVALNDLGEVYVAGPAQSQDAREAVHGRGRKRGQLFGSRAAPKLSRPHE